MPGQKNILITSALPYVNNVPHLGNIIGCVLSADVFARWCRLRGLNALYVCGTDEYGTATETKAAEEGLTPRQICDKYFAQHSSIYEWFDIAFDHFGRTSAPDPWSEADKEWPQTKIAQGIFKDLLEAGNLQEQTVEQVFCKGCDKFLADRFIEGECPHCHYNDARGDQCDGCGKLLNAPELLKPRCKANGEHAVELRTSKHLFLDLPKIEPALRDWLATVTPGWTHNAVGVTDSWLTKGLAPRCITRDLKWGTPVPHPDFAGKVFYVWFDAPIGYISITANYTPEWQKWWCDPDNVTLYQFMGKDNVPFHSVIFPSSLLGTGKPWTKVAHLSATEWLNYEGGKFSKSRGVGVFGDSARDTGVPSEVWRYYLLSNRPETSDSMFTWRDFAAANNNELLKNVGNLVQRICAFTHATYGGAVPAPATPLNERDTAFIEATGALLKRYNTEMEGVKIRAALFTVMAIGFEANKYLQDSAPWDLKASDPARCATVVSLAMASVRLVSIVAEPFMPGFTDKVCTILDMPHADAIPEALAPGLIPAGHVIGKPSPLFSVITDDMLDGFRARFGGAQEAAAAADGGAAAGGAAAGGAGAPAAAAAAAAPAAGKGKGGKGGAAPAAAAAAAPLTDAAAVDLRVGEIVKVWPHPDADKLWLEHIDLGEPTGPRQIASGLRPYYSAEQMLGRKVLVVCNLKPRPMVGKESAGMVLCASNADRTTVEFVDPPAGARVGERITIAGHSESPVPPGGDPINPAKKNNPWTAFAAELCTDASRVATYKGVPLTTSAGACTAPTVASGPIS